MSIDRAKIRKEIHPHGGRYVYAFPDGSEAELAFSEEAPGIVAIVHTGTPPAHRGQGVAAALVESAVDDFRAEHRKVMPLCPFARLQFDRHPEWSDLRQPQ